MAGKPAAALNEAAFESNLARRVDTRFNLALPADVAVVAQGSRNGAGSTFPFQAPPQFPGVPYDHMKRPAQEDSTSVVS
jgi:hypothetical protein